MFIYDDNGVEWGITEIYSERSSNNEVPNGWVPMSQLSVVYDSAAFMDEHADKIQERDFDLGTLTFDGDMVMWSWPGSGQIAGTFDMQHIMGETNMNIGTNIYTDEQGREWGYLGYFYGFRNLWVFLEDPSNKDIPAFNPAPNPNLFPSSDPPAISNNALSRLSPPMLAISLVSLVAMLSLVLIRVLWDRKIKDKSNGSKPPSP